MNRIAAALVALSLSLPVIGATLQITQGSPTTYLKAAWANTDLVACGAVTTCNITIGTLPARGKVAFAFVRSTGAAAGPTTVTVSLGRTSTAFIDYVVASNAKATGVYGDVSGERGTNMADAFFGDVPSLSTTTAVVLQFVSTGGNLSTVTGSTGEVLVRYEVVP